MMIANWKKTLWSPLFIQKYFGAAMVNQSIRWEWQSTPCGAAVEDWSSYCVAVRHCQTSLHVKTCRHGWQVMLRDSLWKSGATRKYETATKCRFNVGPTLTWLSEKVTNAPYSDGVYHFYHVRLLRVAKTVEFSTFLKHSARYQSHAGHHLS